MAIVVSAFIPFILCLTYFVPHMLPASSVVARDHGAQVPWTVCQGQEEGQRKRKRKGKEGKEGEERKEKEVNSYPLL